MTVEQSTTTPLVGRTDEIARLSSLVGLDTAPGGRSVLLAGDAGVGKTRLLLELRDRARASGWRVLAGHCLDFGDSALPYLPFTEILGRLASEAPALTESVAEANPAIRRLLPGMRLLSDRVPAGVAAGAMDTEHMDRGDLFESVHAAFEQVAAVSPLLVVVEDVHWADQSTREMLSFCFTRQFSAPVAVVASYRSDDLHRRHPLRATAAEWSRLPQVSALHLTPLDDPDVRTLVRSLHPAQLRESDVHAIVERAEGNAFFVEELLDATHRGGHALPWHLADLLLVRLDQFDDAGRQVVRAAAGAGRRVSHALLSRVVDLEARSLDRALRDAVEGNVLVPVGSDGYAFRHALLAEAIYDDLLPGERVRLHGAYADALRSGEVGGTAAELARHARAAHDVATAIRASIRAGDDAMAVGGPDEAARHYELALELLTDVRAEEQTGADDGEPVDVVGLTVKASEAVTVAGQPYRSIALVQDQLERLPQDGPDLDRARLLLALATATLQGDTAVVNALDVTTEALSLLPEEAPGPLRAHLLTIHAWANADRQRDDDASRWAGEALSLGHELDLPTVVSAATTTLARLDERAGDPEGSRRAFEQVVARARDDGDAAAELRGLHHLGGVHFEAGRLDEALTVFRTATARAAELGRPWAPYGLDARMIAAVTAYINGEWDGAARILDVRGQAPPGLAEAALTAVGLSLAAGRGDLSALEAVPQLRTWWDREGMIANYTGFAAIDLLGDSGDGDAALALHDEVIASVTALWQRELFDARIRLSALMLGQLAGHATRSAAADRPELVRRGDELAATAAEVAARSHRRKRGVGPEGHAWKARVDAEHARLRWLAGVDPPAEDDLVAVWDTAVRRFEQFGHVFETARSQARLAAVLRAVGRTADARPLLEQARAVAGRLRAEPLLTELRALGSASAARAETERQDQALTPRELEILALVAEGRSNSDIGRQLFISAKTVSVHVSNILAKLRAGSRTEAAAVARRRGLLSD